MQRMARLGKFQGRQDSGNDGYVAENNFLRPIQKRWLTTSAEPPWTTDKCSIVHSKSINGQMALRVQKSNKETQQDGFWCERNKKFAISFTQIQYRGIDEINVLTCKTRLNFKTTCSYSSQKAERMTKNGGMVQKNHVFDDAHHGQPLICFLSWRNRQIRKVESTLVHCV